MAKMHFSTSDHSLPPGRWATFNEWKEKGYGVWKGEKATRFRHGVALFHESQVGLIEPEDFDLHEEICVAVDMCGPMWWKD